VALPTAERGDRGRALAAGKEELDSEGPSTHVVLVVGGSAHKIDRYLNSTPAKVIRQDRFEVFVVP
jgi:hypothetical protein